MRKYTFDEQDRLHQHIMSKGVWNGSCYEWTSNKHTFGYGQQYVNGKPWTVHRIVWKLVYGFIPDDAHILHSCDNPACFRIDHLFLGNHNVNMADRYSKRRYVHGQDVNTTKLTDAQVREIYALKGQMTQRALAQKYGVTQRAIWNILNNKGWRHLNLLAVSGPPVEEQSVLIREQKPNREPVPVTKAKGCLSLVDGGYSV